MTEINLNIEGMSCQHCIMSVKKAIGALKGVEQTEVSIGNAVVKYDDSRIKGEEIEAAIEKAGYKISK